MPPCPGGVWTAAALSDAGSPNETEAPHASSLKSFLELQFLLFNVEIQLAHGDVDIVQWQRNILQNNLRVCELGIVCCFEAGFKDGMSLQYLAPHVSKVIEVHV